MDKGLVRVSQVGGGIFTNSPRRGGHGARVDGMGGSLCIFTNLIKYLDHLDQPDPANTHADAVLCFL
jgi:hypothetical protein